MKVSVLAFHGFLGTPEDWTPLKKELQKLLPDSQIEWLALDLLSSGTQLNPSLKLEEWCKETARFVESEFSEPPIVLGYSMGGRLALHLSMMFSKLFKASLLLSTHPGLESEEEKYERVLHDKKWSEKFLSENWSELMKEWNSQAVFKNEEERILKEESFSRDYLALALESWSLGKHLFDRDQIKELQLPSLWLAGELDSKFVALQEGLPQSSGFRAQVVPGKGHRLITGETETIARKITEFIKLLQ